MELNWLAIAVAAVVHFASGMLWFHPKGMGTIWMRSIGFTQDDVASGPKHFKRAMVITFICSLLISMSTVHYVALVKATSIGQAFYQLLCPIIGFVLAPVAMGIEFEKRGWGYLLTSGGYAVLGVVLAGLAAVLL